MVYFNLREDKLVLLISVLTWNPTASLLNSSWAQEGRHNAVACIWVFRHTLLHSPTSPSPQLICPTLASKINLYYLPITFPLLCSDQAPRYRCCDISCRDLAADLLRMTLAQSSHQQFCSLQTHIKRQLLKQSHTAKQSSLINRENIKKLQKVLQKVFYPVRHKTVTPNPQFCGRQNCGTGTNLILI